MMTDTDYKLLEYQYGDKKVNVYALTAASTDSDLTGQIVWQAADIFGKWVSTDDNGTSLFSGKSVLELGSGAGLGGFLAAHWAS